MRVNRLLLSSLFLLPLAAQVNAQGDLIEEIVVTAAKRAQSLQEIPIAVSVTSADTIEKAQIQDINDLQSVVPSLRVTTLQTSRNTNFVIRGFGNGANNPGIEPSVGVFVDGVYRSRSAAAISDLPRLERVEVLRGPQSTLFGKNASAGVISVVTPKPSGDSGGYISGSFGDYSAVVIKALYEGAFSDNLSFDISGSYNQRDGYFDNNTLGTELNERNRSALRGQLVYSPSDSTEIRVIADYDTLDETCCGVVNILSGPATGAINLIGGQLVPNDPSALEGFYDNDAVNEVDNAGISLQADIDYENFVLTSITSYRTSEAIDDQDIDFSSAALTSSNKNDIDIDTFTQEVRLTSSGGGNIDWMVGGFYFDESVDYQSDVVFGPAFRSYVDILSANALGGFEALFGLPAGSAYANGTGSFESSTLENEAISLFGQVDFHVSDALTLTAGLNYTKDEKTATLNQIVTEPFTSNVPLRSLIAAGVVPPTAGALLFIPNTVDIPNAIEDNSTDDDETTFTLRAAFDVSDSLNIYASAATGFKSSSWNLSRDSAPTTANFQAIRAAGLAVPNLTTGSRFAGPEEATVYELGLKARFERGSFNLAIFDQEIEGFQSNLFVGTGFVLLNAGSQSTQGMEWDLTYYPTDALKLGFAGTYLDPIYDSFPGAQGPGGVITDLTGEQPAGIHELSLTASAEYSFRVGDMDAYIRGDLLFEDEVQVVENIAASIASREVNLLNLSGGVTTENGLSFTLWARNVTDEDYLLSAFPSVAQTGSVSGYRNEPRTIGVTIKKDF